jgi:hypothetical protein
MRRRLLHRRLLRRQLSIGVSQPFRNALQDGLNLARRHWLAEVKALHVASGQRDGAQVIERLDTLRDRAHLQLLCQTGHGVNYGDAIGALRAV